MVNIQKKIITDDYGKPLEVIIPWTDFCHIAEMMGLDLDLNAIKDLKQARYDRECGNYAVYSDLDDI